MDDLVIERQVDYGDFDFIMSSWLRSFRLSEFAKSMPKKVFYEGQQEVANRLILMTKSCRSWVLVSSEDPNTIVAWIIGDMEWIHYLYVKQSFRRMCLAKRLVGDPKSWKGYTHKSLMSQKIKLPKEWVYNPYEAWCY